MIYETQTEPLPDRYHSIQFAEEDAVRPRGEMLLNQGENIEGNKSYFLSRSLS